MGQLHAAVRSEGPVRDAAGLDHVRHVLAVIAANPEVARRAAQIAREHDARLTLVQAWHPPVVLWALGSGGMLGPDCHATAVDEEEAGADRRLRSLVEQHAAPGLTFRCRRGRQLTVAWREALVSGCDLLVVGSSCRSLGWSRRLRHDLRVLVVP